MCAAPAVLTQLSSEPDLRIEISVQENQTVSCFKSVERTHPPIFGPLTSAKLPMNYAEIRKQFRAFKDTVKLGNPASAESLTAAFRQLHMLGFNLLTEVVGIKGLRPLSDFLIDLRQRLGAKDVLTIYVEQSPNQVLPIEIWPLWNLNKSSIQIRGETEAEFAADLKSVSEAFLGFSAVVVHEFKNSPLPPIKPLWEGNDLPVRKFHFAGLKGVQQELEIFKPPAFRMLPKPWPADGKDQPEAFCDLLWDRGGEHRIHHFCCHFSCQSIESETYLHLAHDPAAQAREDKRYCISLASIRYAFGQFELNAPHNFDVRPLLFLNACGTAAIDPAALGSLPLLMLESGFGGVIGTYTNVPTLFAQKFAERFYWSFVNGIPLGRALLSARRALLKESKNPLGILYTTYADPALHVVPEKEPRPWQVSRPRKPRAR